MEKQEKITGIYYPVLSSVMYTSILFILLQNTEIAGSTLKPKRTPKHEADLICRTTCDHMSFTLVEALGVT